MWIRRSNVLAPLSKLLSKDVKWSWTKVESKSFQAIKRIIAREVLLAHPTRTQAFAHFRAQLLLGA